MPENKNKAALRLKGPPGAVAATQTPHHHYNNIINIYSTLKCLAEEDEKKGRNTLGNHDYIYFSQALKDIHQAGSAPGVYFVNKNISNRLKQTLEYDPEIKILGEHKKNELLNLHAGNNEHEKIRSLAHAALEEYKDFTIPHDIGRIRSEYFDNIYESVKEELYEQGLISKPKQKQEAEKPVLPAALAAPMPAEPLPMSSITVIDIRPKHIYKRRNYEDVKQSMSLNYMLSTHVRNSMVFIEFLEERKSPDSQLFLSPLRKNFQCINILKDSQIKPKDFEAKLEYVRKEFHELDSKVHEYICDHELEGPFASFVIKRRGQYWANSSSARATTSTDVSRSS